MSYEITAKKATASTQVTREVWDDSTLSEPITDVFARLEREHQAFQALPPEEQERLRAEQREREAIAKAERTCEHCGCDPDEHGDRS